MSTNPYRSQKDHAFWSRGVVRIPDDEVDPVVAGKFKIGPRDKVVTAGSCFAQHIARNLAKYGLNFLITESAHPLAPSDLAEKFGYGIFSARYGNIYTSRQMLQLLDRAYGNFHPSEDYWVNDGRYFDPFRPSIQPGGFSTLEEFHRDREQHFAAVRTAVDSMDVFIFTLGLTECWASKTDGAVFPVCPGVAAGTYDPDKYSFLNLTVDDVVQDFMAIMERYLSRDTRPRVILTVSPVPLAATALDRHVLVSTTYSKAVLRVAADEIEKRFPARIAYFPAYEIISGSYARSKYYADDLRNVTEGGVSHVMRLFFKHYTHAAATMGPHAQDDAGTANSSEDSRAHSERMHELVRVACEEELLDFYSESAVNVLES